MRMLDIKRGNQLKERILHELLLCMKKLVITLAITLTFFGGQAQSDSKNKIPDPVLYLYPCNELCEVKESFSGVTYFTPKTEWKGHPVIAGLREYRISLIRKGSVMIKWTSRVTKEQNNGKGFNIDVETKDLLNKARKGDVIKIDKIIVSLPDGTNRTIQPKEIKM